MPAPATPWSHAKVTFGTPRDLLQGRAGTLSIKVTPFFDNGVTRLTWAATGDPVFIVGQIDPSDSEGRYTIYLPHVDQDGFHGPTGQPIKGWKYQVDITATIAGTTFATYTKIIQPIVGQGAENAPIDGDLLPDLGGTIPQTSISVPAVTSVAGRTGIVTVEHLVAALDGLIGGGAPEDHTHPISDVDQLQETIDALTALINGRALTSHTHSIAQVTNLQSALDALSAAINQRVGLSAHEALVARVTALETAQATMQTALDTKPRMVLRNADGSWPAVPTDPAYSIIYGDLTDLEPSDPPSYRAGKDFILDPGATVV